MRQFFTCHSYCAGMIVMLLIAPAFGACSSADDVGLLPTLAALPTEPLIQELSVDADANGVLSSREQVDFWRFAGQRGETINLRARGLVNLRLEAPDGSVLGVGNDLNLRLPADGDYMVQVRMSEAESGHYELGLLILDSVGVSPTPERQVVGVPTPTAAFADLGSLRGRLVAGAAAGEIFATGTGRSHVFTFDGAAGEFVTIRMQRMSGTVDPTLTLYNPRGRALATDHNSGGDRAALLRNILLPESGLYSLQATGGGFPGSYEILFETSARPAAVTPTIVVQPTAMPLLEPLAPTPRPEAQGVRLEDHAPVLGVITQPGGLGRHTFIAQAGEAVTIGIRPAENAAFRPLVEVYDPNGERIAVANARDPSAAGGAFIPALALVESGPYTILVTAEGNGTGGYIVSYGSGMSNEDVMRGRTDGGSSFEGRIERRGVRDVWTLVLNRGDVITAAVTSLDNIFDPVLELAAPDGNILASDDNGGGYPDALIASAAAPVSGLYRLHVSGANAASSGPYRIVWRYINLAPTATAEPPRILLMSVEDTVADSEYRFYPFQGRAGQRVQIRVIAQPDSALDAVAALLDDAGRVVAEVDDVGDDLNPRFTLDIPQDGTYTVRVNGYLSSGAFELYVEALFERSS